MRPTRLAIPNSMLNFPPLHCIDQNITQTISVTKIENTAPSIRPNTSRIPTIAMNTEPPSITNLIDSVSTHHQETTIAQDIPLIIFDDPSPCRESAPLQSRVGVHTTAAAETEITSARQHSTSLTTTRAHSSQYFSLPPMRPWYYEIDPGERAKLEASPGCCCSKRGGLFCSEMGGCCFSSGGGVCFSGDGGFCCSCTRGCCFSCDGGWCFSCNGGVCCSNGEARCSGTVSTCLYVGWVVGTRFCLCLEELFRRGPSWRF